MWRNFAIGAPTAREGEMDQIFLQKGVFFSGLSAIGSKFLKRGIPRFRNSQNEGSLKSGIPETKDCSKRWPTDGAACSCVKSDY